MKQQWGPNVFEKYLSEDVRPREVFQGGWFLTGELARFDEDGFPYIEGGLSRFSKIAGEMVSPEAIETNIVKSLSFKDRGESASRKALPMQRRKSPWIRA